MLALYVTGHGYGHATRAAALAAALRSLEPRLDLEVRTEAPSWLFTEQSPGVKVSRGGADAGLVQRDALDVDLEASVERQRALDERWPALVAEEARWLRGRAARLVVGDIPPLAFAAAAEAGVPSLGVSNFCWDWVFEPYEREDARWGPARRRCAAAYALAERAYRLPLHGDFPSFRAVEDVPLLCRLGSSTREGWLRERGLPGDGRPLVLAAFGGFDVALTLPAGEDLGAFLFAGFGEKPPGLRADWVRLRSGTSRDQLEAVSACDVVLTKPGYGILSEALAHGKRVLYVPREGFREIGPLVAGLRERGACAALPREDFAAGRWRSWLEALLAVPAPARARADGAAVLARALLERHARPR
jgi:L-arabinokinase